MTSERHERLYDLFHAARALDPEQRRAVLDMECGDDTEMRKDVELLLAQDEAAGDGGTTDTVRADGAQLRSGQRIGHYKILEQIGEGGFAVVYLAEQEEPVRRRAAIKTIKLGIDTRAQRISRWIA